MEVYLVFNKVKKPYIFYNTHIGKRDINHFLAHILDIQQSGSKYRVQNQHVLFQMSLSRVIFLVYDVASPNIETFPLSKEIEKLYPHQTTIHVVFFFPLVKRSEYNFTANVLHDSFGTHGEEVALIHFFVRYNAENNNCLEFKNKPEEERMAFVYSFNKTLSSNTCSVKENYRKN